MASRHCRPARRSATWARPARTTSTSTTTRSRATTSSRWTRTATRSSSGLSASPRPSRSSTRAAAHNPTHQQQEPGAVELYVAALGFGLISASVIAIAAVGFTMQFGITNMINLAYGEGMISSAYLAYFLKKAGVSNWSGMGARALFGAGFFLFPDPVGIEALISQATPLP